ncbi:low temperature requirement protein A [Psychromicrobium sp. YIM B11713]|uniref:low temperature requirement protein A n=1 Tax=Psychromicrobium sp. YIM B11713 TaxID=3145233 RepID=UPI00374F815A
MRFPSMIRRDPHESHRVSTPLELFFDLVFVVAVGAAGRNLLSFEAEGHFSVGLLGYAMAFFAIWWAWMNFTWFATSYGTDDWYYRVLTLVQMAGALVFAAGVTGIANPEHPDFTLGITGYIIMRVAIILQWIRAAIGDPAGRKTALSYAVGIAIVQVYWVVFAIAVPDGFKPWMFLLGIVAELAVPVLAERSAATPWHRHHITERYGLFTIIVLGESVLASTTAIIEASNEHEQLSDLLLIAGTGFVIVACLWWIYFALPQHELLSNLKTALRWGYGHYFVFAAAAAVSAGIEVALEVETHHSKLDSVAAAATLCIPVAVFVFFVWLLAIRPQATSVTNVVAPAAAVLILLSVFVPFSQQITAVILVLLVVFLTAYAVPHRTKHLG